MRIFPGLIMFLSALCLQAAQEAADDIPQRKRQNPEAIRVVTANIRFLTKADYETGNGWDQRKELCRDVLLAQDADIICIQENRTPQSDYLISFLPEFEFFDGLYRSKHAINPIVYSTKRFKKLDGAGFWLSPTPNIADSRFPDATTRLANWLLLQDKLTGKKLYVINTHLDHIRNEDRVKQLSVIIDFVKTLPPDVPRIMTGDFNSGKESPPLKMLDGTGWLDSYTLVNGPAETGGTAHRFLGPEFLSTPEGRERVKIDFILHNKLLKPTAAEVIRDSRKGKYPSDHYFASAELQYTKD